MSGNGTQRSWGWHPLTDAWARRLVAEAGVRPGELVQADAADLWLPRQPFRVVASPPYGIASALVARLLSRGSRLTEAHLVLQRAAARRFAAGDMRGAARWARTWEVALGRPVPRSAFRPPPAVDSCVLVVRRRRP